MITYKGRQIPQTLEEILNPEHTALLVHEMLNDFVTPGGVGTSMTGDVLDISSILPPMTRLIDTARKKGVRVAYARMTTYNDYRNASDPVISRSYKRMMDPKTKLAGLDGTWGHEIRQEVGPKEGDLVVNKFRTDAFFQTNLDLLLRSNRIRTFIIVGIGAEAGGVPTVIHGTNLGYFTVVAQDCLRPTDMKNYDDAMLILKDWAIMSTSSEITKAWGA